MAGTDTGGLIDPNTGFCLLTKTFHSLRPSYTLPPPSQPLSVAEFTFSLLHSSIAAATNTSAATFLINAVTGQRLTYADFLRQTNSLAISLPKNYSLSKNDVAYILCPSSFHIPVLYFSLLSIGVIISPANPLSSTSEISHQIQISKPTIAFATSHTSRKLPPNLRTILVDSPEFLSLLSIQNQNQNGNGVVSFTKSTPAVNQSDSAAIFYSSGTTGKMKGVLLTQQNLIALVAIHYHSITESIRTEPSLANLVELMMLPLFHVFGFFSLMKGVCMAQTLVLMEKFDFGTMLKTVEKYKITYLPVSPPIIVVLTKSELTKKYDLTSLRLLRCGGAPLSVGAAGKFKEKFPDAKIIQGYGLTEGGLAAETRDAEKLGSVGRLVELMEAKIVDSVSGEALPPGQKGELLLRGPSIMKGYVGNDKATAETLDSEGWLKTGDLCYFDSEGFLFIVDRLKELIKYKGYQVPPAELEHLLQSNPDIVDAAVIPYPDEAAGQIPMAFVVRKPGSNITEAQVMDFTAKQVAPQKKIRRVAFINSIPKSAAGKLLRRELLGHAVSNNFSKL
ncbi:4-coumarate:CoA ligase-like protein [Melia azedarach]|uniref:4-coumarate:CoA ligase-like protein n=1 Tax=Melia azedarach TaxID=155640 RepID=A0ACC1XMH9_MELAZ|nr:4-coumarate:CoA ligase-like protein [Melia azedarach]